MAAGEIIVTRETPKEISLEWQIEDFSSLLEEQEFNFISPKFLFSGEKWNLQTISSRTGREDAKSDICAILVLLSSCPKILLDYSFSLKKLDGTPDCLATSAYEFNFNSLALGKRLISSSELMRRKSELLPSDTLTVQYTLRVKFCGVETGLISVIQEAPDEISLEWDIANYRNVNIESHIFCPKFSFLDANWSIYLSLDCNDVGIIKEDGSVKFISCALSIRNTNGVHEYVYREQKEFLHLGFVRGEMFPGRSELVRKKAELLPSGVLKICCNMKAISPPSIKSSLIQDLGNLLLSGKGSDVILKVNEREFHVHRFILQLRLPDFFAKFKENLSKKPHGLLTIEGCDPDAFMDFLHFIYTGYVEDFSAKKALNLYPVAEEYHQPELKEECLDYLKNNVTVGEFCNIMTLGILHQEAELLEIASRFFFKRGCEIMRTEKWKIFLKCNINFGNDLILKFVDDKCDCYFHT